MPTGTVKPCQGDYLVAGIGLGMWGRIRCRLLTPKVLITGWKVQSAVKVAIHFIKAFALANIQEDDFA